VSSAGGSFSHAWLHVGSDFTIRCSTYPDQVPILSIDAGSNAISLTSATRDVTDDALRFARSLARHAQEFADEVERMHATQLADDVSAGQVNTAASGKATDPKAA
jgi:hypothetical protein